MKLRLLVVEDDPDQRNSWEMAIRYYNQEGQPVQFDVIFATSQEEATTALKAQYIHCASIDLRMPVGGQSDGPSTAAVGNALLKLITHEIGIPTVVYSAATEDADEFVGQTRIKLISKGRGDDPLREAITWLASHAPLIEAMEESHRKMRIVSAGLFSDYLWPRWADAWRTRSDPKFKLSSVVARHLAAHIAEAVVTESGAYHPEEVFIKPPMNRLHLSTGDIVRRNDGVFVIVTPRCNLANTVSPRNIILAPCMPVGDTDSIKQGLADPVEKRKVRAMDALRRYATQGHALSTHFLPPCGEEGPWLIDFRECVSVGESDIPSLITSRIASISSAFLPNLVQRYAAYIGRIGQPELDCNALAECLRGMTSALPEQPEANTVSATEQQAS